MEIKPAIKGQYHSALAMLRQAVERCPDDLWTLGDHPRSFWRIAYHTLFYTHLYLQPTEADFNPWERHREGSQALVPDRWPPDPLQAPYSKQDVLDYLAFCDAMVDDGVDRLDLAAQETGFWWYKMPKLDHQLMNIRHVQQHAGQLSELLMAVGVDTDWKA